MDNKAAYEALVSRLTSQVEEAIRPRYELPISDRKTITDMLSATYKAEVVKRGMTFVDDEVTRDRISRVANWMRGESKPGLLIYGNKVGTGKTTMSKAIYQVLHFFHDEPMFRDARVTETEVITALDLIRLHRDKPQEYSQLMIKHRLIIDDVGTEAASVKVYGTESSPLTELLFARYDRQLWTILTSNLSDDDLQQRYGIRLADRFREMFDRILFDGNSYRK